MLTAFFLAYIINANLKNKRSAYKVLTIAALRYLAYNINANLKNKRFAYKVLIIAALKYKSKKNLFAFYTKVNY